MKKFLLWLGIIAGVAVGGAYLLLSLTTDEYVIDSDPIIAASVAPNLNPGDTVRIAKWTGAAMGHLVRCSHPRGDGRQVVGRVIGESGDRVGVANEMPSINGRNNPAMRTCGETHMASPTSRRDVPLTCIVEEHGRGVTVLRATEFLDPEAEWKVGPGKYFLLSDNRHMHMDSRDFGSVDAVSCKPIVARVASKPGLKVQSPFTAGLSILW